MGVSVRKNLILIIFLLILISLIWFLNQKKNFNPVFSVKTNLSFRSEKSLNYNDLGSIYEVYQLLEKQYPNFNLNAAVKNRDFAVIGRVFKTKNDEVSVFEFGSSDKAEFDYNRLLPEYGNRLILYKNLIVLTGSENEVLTYLKENLR
jgi:hypothetical protein